jgi:hypothetical protein
VFEHLAEPRFDPQFNFCGGGDTDFFTRARHAGLAFYWTQDAVITETVPPERAQHSWLARRGICIGVSNYRTARKLARTWRDKAWLVGKNTALVPLAVIRAAGFLVRGDARSALHPLYVVLGRLLAAVGLEPRQYGPARGPLRFWIQVGGMLTVGAEFPELG